MAATFRRRFSRELSRVGDGGDTLGTKFPFQLLPHLGDIFALPAAFPTACIGFSSYARARSTHFLVAFSVCSLSQMTCFLTIFFSFAPRFTGPMYTESVR